MRILITGSGGFVGRNLKGVLEAANHSVIVLRRTGIKAAPTDDVFEGPADLADLNSWRFWPRDIDAAVHLAACNPSRLDPAASDFSALRRANVEATGALAARAAREGVARVLYLSSANVHGSFNERPITENDPPEPRSPYAASKMEAEQAFWHALAGSRTEGCILRPGPVYGQGGRGRVAALVKLARLPLPLPISELGGPRSLIAVDHLAQVIALALEAPAAAGEVFLVADEGPLAPAAIVAAVRRGWGRAPGIFPSPARPLAFLAQALGKGDIWRGATGAFVLNTSRLRERLGWCSPTSAEVKLQQLAASGAFS